MKTTYLVEQKRFLLKYFAAKSPWTVLYFLLPLSIALIFFLTRIEDFSLKSFALALPLAFLYWSLVEYIIHRWYFHLVPKNEKIRAITGSFHLYHHENPDDLEVINSGWVTGSVGVIFHFSVFRFLFGASTLQSLYLILALLVVYYAYEWVHYLVHQRIFKNPLMRYLQNFHLTHHIRPKCNYGQITPIWDYVLGTVKENMETKDHANMRRLIKGES